MYTDYIKDFYTINQSYYSIYITIQIVGMRFNYICWYRNIWLNDNIKFFYTNSVYKLNPIQYVLLYYLMSLTLYVIVNSLNK